MSNTRTSNKQILEAIEKLTETIANAMVPNQTVTSEPVVPTLAPISQPKAEKPTDSTLRLNKTDQTRLARMEVKFADYSAKIGEPVVGYAYNRPTKVGPGFWSVPLSKWNANPKIRNFIGAIGIYDANGKQS